MRLKTIRLAGFKSFVDPTTIHFPSRLTGVVGPNGCGKSNVVDAVRWVMGESSAKSLRGEGMADVVFNGSNARKPVGQASVELVFDNSEGRAAGPYAAYNELAVKRQVNREGHSTYILNGTRCRRKDVIDLFLGTGLGPRSYSIIQQDMISRLIEARPEELRHFLEEAAGISRYKERRRETENRMRHTRDNLDRINDVREEVGRQLQHLQRQARAAERYQALKDEERTLRAQWLLLRLKAVDADLETRRRAVEQQQTALEEVRAEQRQHERDLEEARTAQGEVAARFNQVQGRYYGLNADVARVEEAMQYARERRRQQQEDLEAADHASAELGAQLERDREALTTLDQRISDQEAIVARARDAEQAAAETLRQAEQAVQQWQETWAAFKERAAEPQQAAEVERTRIDHAERRLQELDGQIRGLEAERQGLEMDTLDQAVSDLESERRTMAEEMEAARARLARLDEALADARRRRDELAETLEACRARLREHRGRLHSLEALQEEALGSDDATRRWLEARGLEQAPRAAECLEVEPGWEPAVEAVLGEWLQAVCVQGLEGAGLDTAGDRRTGLRLVEGDTAPGPAEGLAARVRGPAGLRALLEPVTTAEDRDRAMAARHELASGQSVVTTDGVWLGRGWARLPGDRDAGRGVLERARDIEQLKQAAAEEAERESELAQRLADAESERDGLETERERAREAGNEAYRRHADATARLEARQGERRHAEARGSRLDEGLRQARSQREETAATLRAARGHLEEALSRMEACDAERRDLEAQRSALDERLGHARDEYERARQAAHDAALRLESLRSTYDSTRQAVARVQEQLTQASQRADTLRSTLSNERVDQHADELQRLLAQRQAVEAELGQIRQHQEAVEARVRALERGRSVAERRVSELRETLEGQRLELQEVTVRRETLQEQLTELDVDRDAVAAGLPEDAEPDAWHQRLAEIEKRIQRLGAVNLAAIDEYAERQERKVYLDAQYDDLTEALETLENAIKRIDRETRTRFQDVFDRVNQSIQDIFPRLFGGGRAYLEQTGEDLLDTGVAVMGQPPGKRISTIHLLSGGEKALTAVALVFALFELNPAPLCLLDEVDAPLDDANVGRFCQLVSEMSDRIQFVFVTHNKVTMEMANHLIGVTMNEPGVSRLVAVDVDQAVEIAAAG